MGFSLPSIKCSAAPPSFRLLPSTVSLSELYSTIWLPLITARSTVVGGWEESPNTWLTVAKNAFVSRALNVRVRMLLKGAVMLSVISGNHHEGRFPRTFWDCFRVRPGMPQLFMNKNSKRYFALNVKSTWDVKLQIFYSCWRCKLDNAQLLSSEFSPQSFETEITRKLCITRHSTLKCIHLIYCDSFLDCTSSAC